MTKMRKRRKGDAVRKRRWPPFPKRDQPAPSTVEEPTDPSPFRFPEDPSRSLPRANRSAGIALVVNAEGKTLSAVVADAETLSNVRQKNVLRGPGRAKRVEVIVFNLSKSRIHTIARKRKLRSAVFRVLEAEGAAGYFKARDSVSLFEGPLPGDIKGVTLASPEKPGGPLVLKYVGHRYPEA